jgi:hypothetical protein
MVFMMPLIWLEEPDMMFIASESSLILSVPSISLPAASVEQALAVSALLDMASIWADMFSREAENSSAAAACWEEPWDTAWEVEATSAEVAATCSAETLMRVSA